MVKMVVDTLPKPSTLVKVMVEMKGLARQQLAEQLTVTDKLHCTVMEHLKLVSDMKGFRC